MSDTMRFGATILSLLSLCTTACDRTPEARSDPKPPATPAVAASAGPAPSTATSFRLPSRARLVAIGDIHGDLAALRAALRLAGAIDGDDRWVGKDLTVVQVGDQVDRGDQDREVLDVLEKLELEARKTDSELIVLNGNHELMNAGFDFRYVTAKSFASFAELSQRAPAGAERLPGEERGRAAAFAPGGPYALKLSRHLTVAVVGDTLFAHGGVLPAHVDYGLSRINEQSSAFLAGRLRQLPKVLAADDAPIWTRFYGEPEVDGEVCQVLGRVLQQVGVRRLVVGHTVQKGGISGACEQKLFRIDVGLSAYYGSSPTQVLEIAGDGSRILTAGKTGGADKSGARPSPELHSAP
jgi:hypothetical protein